MNPYLREQLIGLVVLVVTVASVVTMLTFLGDQSASSKVPYDCVDATERERVRQLAFDGVDRGLVDAMAHLFDIWTKDPQNSQPQRAQVGTTNAVNAHIRARKLVFAWDPQPCPEKTPP